MRTPASLVRSLRWRSDVESERLVYSRETSPRWIRAREIAYPRFAHAFYRPHPLVPLPQWTHAYAQDEGSVGRRRRDLWDFIAGTDDVAEGGVVGVYGVYKLRLRFRSSFERVLFASGTYEPSEAWLVRRVMRHGGVFIDVGANEGLFALVAAAQAVRPVRVHAFEPSSRERRRLVDNLRLNHLDDVRVAPLALGARPGSALLRIAREPNCGLNTMGADFAYDAAQAAIERVDVDTLDGYVARNEPRPITAIKIDVEGFEVDVLHGARALLARDGPAIVVEINAAALAQCGRSARELVSLLREHGYELFTIGDGGVLVPLGPAHEQMSLNAVALKPPVLSP